MVLNDCHQQLSDSNRVHKIRFRPGLRPVPHWESLQRAPDLLAGIRGTNSKGEERGGRKARERGRGEEMNVRHRPLLSQIPGSAPASLHNNNHTLAR